MFEEQAKEAKAKYEEDVAAYNKKKKVCVYVYVALVSVCLCGCQPIAAIIDNVSHPTYHDNTPTIHPIGGGRLRLGRR